MTPSLNPYTPSAAQPWDRRSAAHLLRRAGFSPSESEIRAALADGPRATVDRLLDTPGDGSEHDDLDEIGANLAVRDDIGALRGWWLLRMRHTKRPLHARMTVIWHDHFATSNAKVGSAPLMLQQLRTLERYSLGRFEDLLLAMSRDPAMIVWLDGDENIKGRPNENYARELFELFALGVGNYSEADIRDAARAFTGWHQVRGRFSFRALEHDGGAKTVLARSGAWSGEDIVRFCIEQKACAAFIAAMLLRAFVCPDPSAKLVDATAARLRESGFDLRETLRTLLVSEAFFAPHCYRARIKSPVELAVGIARSLEMRIPAPRLEKAVSQMGQRLFEPPSVKGWDGHRAWLNSATMLVRLNAASAAAGNEGFAPAALRQRYDIEDEDVLAFCGNLALDGDVPDALAARLDAIEGSPDERMRQALAMLLSSPEYQMA